MPAKKKFDPNTTPHPTGQWYTPAEVGGLLGVHQTTISREIARGHMPAVKVGTHWRIHSTSVIAYIQANSSQPKEGDDA